MTTILVRGDTVANFASAGTVPALREFVYETDTGLMKVGDGVKTVANLIAINGGSIAASLVAFSAAVPFNGNKYMAEKLVTAPIAFTIDPTGAIDGSQLTLNLIGDGGTNLVSFGTGLNLVGPLDYDPTDGQVNMLAFWRDQGRYYRGNALGPLLPRLTGITVSNTNPSAALFTFNVNLDTSKVPLFSDFTISGHTTTGTCVINANTVSVPVTAAFVNGEAARTGAYTPGLANNKIRGLSQDLMAAFSGVAITNNVTALPTITSVVVQNAAPTILEVNLSAAYSGALPAFGAFAVSAGHSITAIAAGASGTQFKLTTSTAFTASETKTLAYTKPGTNNLKDGTGAEVATVSGIAITDNVAGVTYARYPTLGADVTESGSSGAGWHYNIGSGVSNCAYLQSGNPRFASSAGVMAGDGNIAAVVENYTSFFQASFCLAFYTSGGNFENQDGYTIGQYNGQYRVIGSYGGNITPNGSGTIVPANGDIIRIRRSGTTLVGEVSQNGGTSYTTVHTWTAISATLYPKVGVSCVGGLGLLTSTGVA